MSTRTSLQRLPALPLILKWHASGQPLPLRRIKKPPSGRKRTTALEAPYWLSSGPTDRPFDFCGHMRRLTADVVRHCSELQHIDVTRLLFGITQARSSRPYGLQARVTPLHSAMVN